MLPGTSETCHEPLLTTTLPCSGTTGHCDARTLRPLASGEACEFREQEQPLRYSQGKAGRWCWRTPPQPYRAQQRSPVNLGVR